MNILCKIFMNSCHYFNKNYYLSGPVPTQLILTPLNLSIVYKYFLALSGKSEYFLTFVISVFHPSTFIYYTYTSDNF